MAKDASKVHLPMWPQAARVLAHCCHENAVAWREEAYSMRSGSTGRAAFEFEADRWALLSKALRDAADA